jgi:hypothetical protein
MMGLHWLNHGIRKAWKLDLCKLLLEILKHKKFCKLPSLTRFKKIKLFGGLRRMVGIPLEVLTVFVLWSLLTQSAFVLMANDNLFGRLKFRRKRKIKFGEFVEMCCLHVFDLEI